MTQFKLTYKCRACGALVAVTDRVKSPKLTQQVASMIMNQLPFKVIAHQCSADSAPFSGWRVAELVSIEEMLIIGAKTMPRIPPPAPQA